MNFQNKVAVITGSTAGIGEAVAEQWGSDAMCHSPNKYGK